MKKTRHQKFVDELRKQLTADAVRQTDLPENQAGVSDGDASTEDMIKELKPAQLEESFNQMILDNIKTKYTDSISLLTIHKAKGLEFEIVFIIGFNEGILPGLNKKGQDLEEERRLSYVGITRARKQVYASASKIRINNKNETFNTCFSCMVNLDGISLVKAKC